MALTLLVSHDIVVHVYYSQLALRDELVEEPFERTNALLRSGQGKVAVSSGREIMIVAQGVRTAFVHVDVWNADPGTRNRGGDWDHSPVLTLECPSARIYVESAPDLSHKLRNALPDDAGIYGVRVARRRTGASDPQAHGDPHDEQYVFDLWRTGDLPQEWLDVLAEDDE
jgi:hypothetical protein